MSSSLTHTDETGDVIDEDMLTYWEVKTQNLPYIQIKREDKNWCTSDHLISVSGPLHPAGKAAVPISGSAWLGTSAELTFGWAPTDSLKIPV